MKKYLTIFSLFSLLGACLYGWVLNTGVDESGLYPANHPGWIGYLLMAVIVPLTFYFLIRSTCSDGPCHAPAGHIVGAVGFCIAAATAENRYLMLLHVLSAGALLLLAYQHRSSRKIVTQVYLLPCLSFLLTLFFINYRQGGEPEAVRFLPQFLASFSCAIAVYQLWGQSVGLGHARWRLFWRLTAGYLCIAAIAGSGPVYAFFAIFLLLGGFPAAAPENPDHPQSTH